MRAEHGWISTNEIGEHWPAGGQPGQDVEVQEDVVTELGLQREGWGHFRPIIGRK